MSESEAKVIDGMFGATTADRVVWLRAERAKIAAERDRREVERLAVEELETAERELRDEQALASAEQEHGPIGARINTVQTRSGIVIVKRPNHVLFRRFQDLTKITVADAEKLVRSSLVYPDASTFDTWAEAEPAIIARAANACVVLAGARLEEMAGK